MTGALTRKRNLDAKTDTHTGSTSSEFRIMQQKPRNAKDGQQAMRS